MEVSTEHPVEIFITIVLEGEETLPDRDIRQLAIAVDQLLMRQITERSIR